MIANPSNQSGKQVLDLVIRHPECYDALKQLQPRGRRAGVMLQSGFVTLVLGLFVYTESREEEGEI